MQDEEIPYCQVSDNGSCDITIMCRNSALSARRMSRKSVESNALWAAVNLVEVSTSKPAGYANAGMSRNAFRGSYCMHFTMVFITLRNMQCVVWSQGIFLATTSLLRSRIFSGGERWAKMEYSFIFSSSSILCCFSALWNRKISLRLHEENQSVRLEPKRPPPAIYSRNVSNGVSTSSLVHF